MGKTIRYSCILGGEGMYTDKSGDWITLKHHKEILSHHSKHRNNSLFITYKHLDFGDETIINNVWSVDCDNVEEKYIEFMQEKAKGLNITINPHWLNIMNWGDHNNHLSAGEYSNKKQQWGKMRRQWGIDRFILEILGGQKEYYRDITGF